MSDQRQTRDSAANLTATQLSELRPYVINLTQGRFSSDGRYTTSASDVDAIFAHHLPKFAMAREGRSAPVAIWAHGGLVSEDKGLLIAHGQVQWWLDNGVYPLHFVWETGVLDALKQILQPVSRGRDIADETTDPVIEFAARPIGSRLWLAMKESARLASQTSGGAAYTARRLAEFAKANPSVLWHAIGHSAGSIFHSHFIPTVLSLDGPRLETLSLLAPAITIESFRQTLAPLVGNGIADTAVFAMLREVERADNCMQIYRKSLLYLVSRALEIAPNTPILGLEDSMRQDPEVAKLLGLTTAADHAGVVWSPTPTNAPNGGRSHSESHGGFDNDADTMNSVAYRVLGAPPDPPFPQQLIDRGRALWVDAGTMPPQQVLASPPRHDRPDQPRRAVCVGIDAYQNPRDQLTGAANDARNWATAFEDMGFMVTLLVDGDATRQGIIGALEELLSSAAAGSVVAFQYAGHGTQVPDSYLAERENREEVDGQDEALCPVDFREVGLLLDDDLYRIVCQHLPEKVNLTGFFDCCHSGSAFRGFGPRPDRPDDARPRYVPFESEMFGPANRAAPTLADEDLTPKTWQVLFSACQDNEVAWESGGSGHFTTHALGVVKTPGLTNETFKSAVVAAFGGDNRQHPGIQVFESQSNERPFLGLVAT
jgi:hypothetical protein